MFGINHELDGSPNSFTHRAMGRFIGIPFNGCLDGLWVLLSSRG